MLSISNTKTGVYKLAQSANEKQTHLAYASSWSMRYRLFDMFCKWSQAGHVLIVCFDEECFWYIHLHCVWKDVCLLSCYHGINYEALLITVFMIMSIISISYRSTCILIEIPFKLGIPRFSCVCNPFKGHTTVYCQRQFTESICHFLAYYWLALILVSRYP